MMRRDTHSMRLLRWLNAGFLILAACRALVPGLCATQAAALDNAARNAKLHPCCQVRTQAAAHDDRPSASSRGAEHAECGFCHLVHGMLEALDSCCIVPPLVVGATAHLAPEDLLPRAASRTHLGRAPPILG